MLLEFPEDRTVYHLEQQYMFGPSLLVAPVFCDDTEETEYYLPDGVWTSFWVPKRTITGPRWVRENVAYDDIPVWVRPGSILCLGRAGVGRPDWDYSKALEVRVDYLADGMTAEAVVPTGKGREIASKLKASRQGGKLKVVVVEGALEEWAVTNAEED